MVCGSITVKQISGKIKRYFISVPGKYHLPVIAVILALLVLIHYHEAFAQVPFLERINSLFSLGMTRQTFGRILFLIPIVYGAAVLGIRWSTGILILCAAAMLPRVFLLSSAPKEALFETIGVIFVGLLLVLLINLLHKDKRRFVEIAHDIIENQKAQDNLRFYAQQVSQAQEAERKRIARELHDVTVQSLVTIVRNLGDLDSGHANYSVKEIQEQVRAILKEVRRFSQQLRPSILDDLGLLPAIKWLAADLTQNYSINVDVRIEGEPRQLPPDAELTLFRITQEALTNAQKHSGAKEVTIAIEFNKQSTKVTVGDDGKGFELPERMGDLARSGKLGLAGMQERAQLLGGVLTIDSKPGKGTRLIMEVPL